MSHGVKTLPTLDGATKATLHVPTGLLIVSRGGNHVSGSIDEIERQAAAQLAACWEARQLLKNSRVVRG